MQRHERSFGGFRLSPTPPTRLDEGSSRVKRALLARNARSTLGRRFVTREARVARGERAKHRAANRVSSAIQQYSLTPTASRKSTKTIKSTRLTVGRKDTRIQSKNSPVEGPFSTGGIRLYKKGPKKARFGLQSKNKSDCVRNGLIQSDSTSRKQPFSTGPFID